MSEDEVKKSETIESDDSRMTAFGNDIHIEGEEVSFPKDIKKKRLKDGIINVAALLLQKVEIAVLSSIVFLLVYYTAYLSYKSQDREIKLESSITLGSILVFAQFSSIWIGGVLREYFHIKLILIIGSSLLILACLGLMFFESLLAYQFIMVLFGLGVGIQEAITNANASAFIPKKKGLINGLANISWTLSCSFFNFIGINVVNPEKKDVVLYDDVNNISDNVVKYTIIAIICFGALTTVSSILVFPYKKEKYELKLTTEETTEENTNKENNENKKDNNENNINEINESETNDNDKNNNETNDNENNKDTEEAKEDAKITSENNMDEDEEEIDEEKISFFHFLKTVRLYTCFFLFCFKNIHNNLVLSSFTVFAFHYKTVSVELQQILSTVSPIINFGLTVLLSLFIDKFKYRNIVIPSNIVTVCHALTFQFVKKNQILFIAYDFISGILVTIENLVTFPHLFKVFGNRYVVIIFGIFCMGTGFFDLLMNGFVAHVLSKYDETQADKYDRSVDLLFYMTACFSFISVILMTFENEHSVLHWTWKK